MKPDILIEAENIRVAVLKAIIIKEPSGQLFTLHVEELEE